MSTGIAAIALFAPIVASNAIFSARRVSRGANALEDNPMYALANFDIAAGQILKGGRAAKGLAIVADPSFENATKGATDAIKNASKSSKFLQGAGKVINFTADNINPIIIVASGIKVLGADDKVEEAGRETLRLGCMFGSEALVKDFVGMPYTKKVNGKNVTFKREGSYKKIFTEKQLKAVQDFCATKKAMKYLPGAAKGLIFVGASIAGYKLGDKLSDVVFGEKKKSA